MDHIHLTSLQNKHCPHQPQELCSDSGMPRTNSPKAGKHWWKRGNKHEGFPSSRKMQAVRSQASWDTADNVPGDRQELGNTKQ